MTISKISKRVRNNLWRAAQTGRGIPTEDLARMALAEAIYRLGVPSTRVKEVLDRIWGLLIGISHTRNYGTDYTCLSACATDIWDGQHADTIRRALDAHASRPKNRRTQ